MSAHTKGPWRSENTSGGLTYHVMHDGGYIAFLSAPRKVSNECRPGESWLAMRHRTENAREKLKEEVAANARLLAAAPDLLEALKARVKNEEQRIFEDWLHDKTPSGDVEQVQDQWERSSEYLDFHDAWAVEISAIAKAEGK